MERDIRMLVHNNQLEDFVVCLGAVPVQDMPLYLNAADIYVSSLLSDGTSMSLLEAMACGLPVVVTDVPAILEWVDNGYNGYVVPRRDSEALAVKILELLRDQPLREKMSERNLSIAREQADWEKNFRKLERMYDMLVAGMPAG
jgi:glycosyltransferase involved in cell wall biosynthesis